MDPAAPVPVGQAQKFKIAKVEGAVGPVNFRWNFGDGTPISDPSPNLEATHVYKDASHYTVIVLANDDASGTSASFVQTAHYPLTSVPPNNSSTIVVDAEKNQVWNVNPDSDSVSVIDGDKLTRIREIPVGRDPRSIALAPDGTIWVTNRMSDEVVVLDRTTGEVETRIALPYASQPLAIAFGPTTKTAYVSLFATGKLVEIDPASRMLKREVALGPTPAGISVASDGRIYVTRFISPVDHGEIMVISPESLNWGNTIVLPFDQTADTESNGRGVPNYVSSMVISPDGTQGWVSAKKDDVARGPMLDGQASNSDNFVRALVCSVDLTTGMEVVSRRMDIDNRSMPVSVAFSPVGDYAYILLQANSWIGIYDAYSTLQIGGIKDIGSVAGSAPSGLVLAPSKRLFVNAFLSREVVAYDLSASVASIDQGAPPPLANIRTIDKEPLPAQILLGKQVFMNAMDPRMSNVGYMACGTCHFEGLSDGRVWDFSSRGEGLRNTKQLLGARGVAEGRVHWSANMDEIQDFDRDIRESLGGMGFLPENEFKARLLPSGDYDTFGKPAAGLSKDLDALAAFFATFNRVPRSPFRNPDGSFTADAIAGKTIFENAGCPECHSGPDFTDSATGVLHDVGTILPTSGKRLHGPLTGIDTPSLKGVWMSAPYLHDGRAATLTEIFTTYTKDRMGTVSNLNDVQMAQLVAYLQQLDDEPVTETPEPPKKGGLLKCAATPGEPARGAILAAWFAAGAAITIFRRRRRA
jgi:YVTN family beta-propeller protein